MIAQLPPNRSYKWRVSAVMVVLVLMGFACNQTQDNTQPPPDNSDPLPDGSQVLSDNTEVASGYTGLEHSEDVPKDDTQAPSDSVKVSVDDRQAPTEDLQVDFDYIEWLFDNPAVLLAPPGDPQVDFDYIEWVFENPAAQFVGLISPKPDPDHLLVFLDARGGILWIEYPCVYLREVYPIPLDIQAVADLDLDLEKAASEIASWSVAHHWYRLSNWVPADVQVVYENDPAHRILLQLPRGPSTSYDLTTGELRLTKSAGTSFLRALYPTRYPVRVDSRVSGDLLLMPTYIRPLSDEYRNRGCDARGQLPLSWFNRFSDEPLPPLSEVYDRWR